METINSQEEYKLLKALGGRKFLVTLVSVLANSTLVWFGKIDPGVYSTVAIAVVGGYIAGNVFQNRDQTK